MTPKQMRNAKEKLGVIHAKVRNQTFWALPKNHDAHDAHEKLGASWALGASSDVDGSCARHIFTDSNEEEGYL